MNVSIMFNVIFAGIIAFGVVYNAARVSLSERSRELASLRVLGFTRAEISSILLGELALVTVAALPVGAVLGYGMALAIVQVHGLRGVSFSAGGLAAGRRLCLPHRDDRGAALGTSVRRKLDQLDLVGVLKIRE